MKSNHLHQKEIEPSLEISPLSGQQSERAKKPSVVDSPVESYDSRRQTRQTCYYAIHW